MNRCRWSKPSSTRRLSCLTFCIGSLVIAGGVVFGPHALAEAAEPEFESAQSDLSGDVPAPKPYVAPFRDRPANIQPDGKRVLGRCEHAYYNDYQARKIATLTALEQRLIARYPRFHRAISESLIVQIEQARLDRIAYFHFLERDPSRIRSQLPLSAWAPLWSGAANTSATDSHYHDLQAQQETLALLESNKDFMQRLKHWRLAKKHITHLERIDPGLGGASRILQKAFEGEGPMGGQIKELMYNGAQMAEELGCGNFYR